MKYCTIVMILTFFALGCGRSKPSVLIDESPLTIEQWKELSVEIKYEPSTFERLKLGEPKLQNDREWEKFTRNTLIPARKRDKGA